MPSVSVIIPAYNAAPYVGEAIESALAQTSPPAEVIVVDDGSTDGTAMVLAGFGSRIRVVSTPGGGGAAGSRNAGAAVSCGEWLAFLDADDVWLQQKLEKQLAVIAPDVDLVWTDRYNLNPPEGLPAIQSELQPMYEGDIFEDLLLIGNVITASSVLLRRAAFDALGGFARGVPATEDWDLWVRVAARARVRACREPLVRYRFHGGMSSGDPDVMRRSRMRVIERALASERGQQLPESMKRRIRSRTHATNGWDAARRGAKTMAFQEYGRALLQWPADLGSYKGLLRLCVGRS